jgi:hypothetical protein
MTFRQPANRDFTKKGAKRLKRQVDWPVNQRSKREIACLRQLQQIAIVL